ncbi:MAG: nucleoside triphosphate pyrophosphohydrolase [Christensenellales bacterium]
MITIVGLGNGELYNLTNQAEKALKESKTLVLQTNQMPLAGYLAQQHIEFSTLDGFYEQAEDFDEWANQSLLHIKQLSANGPVCVGLLGDGLSGTLCAALSAAGSTVIPGLSLGRIAAGLVNFPGIALEVFAQDITSFEPGQASFAVTEIDTRYKAADVKLRLGEYYTDEFDVVWVNTKEGTAHTMPLHELDRQEDYNAFCCLLVKGLTFFDKERYGFSDLVYVLRLLREPGGCPWDRKQTHDSLKQCMLEEAYEVLEAIDEKDDEKLCDELGDVLLQVVFHAGIGQDQGSFNDRDVTTAVCKKMIVRHPHVFAKEHCNTADEVLINWEKIKQAERGSKNQTEVMQHVAKTLPALIWSYKIQQKAAAVGFDWDQAKEAFYKIREETDELWEQMELGNNTAMQEELGDLLFAVVNVARKLKLTPELALRSATQKFMKRFASLEELAQKSGRELKSMTLQELDELWNQVKKRGQVAKNSQNSLNFR